MKKLSAPLLAAACFLAFSAHAQTPTQQDSTKNTDVPNQGQSMNQGDQMHKKNMKKDHAKMKKSHKQGNATNDNMMEKGDQSQSQDTQKKESGTPGK